MESYIIHTPSVTYARKGQSVLEKNEIPCRLTRSGSQGCAWGLEISPDQKERALTLLDDYGVIHSIE